MPIESEKRKHLVRAFPSFHSQNKTGRVGVSRLNKPNPEHSGYVAYITFEGKRYHLGFSKSFTHACRMRSAAESAIDFGTTPDKFRDFMDYDQ